MALLHVICFLSCLSFIRSAAVTLASGLKWALPWASCPPFQVSCLAAILACSMGGGAVGLVMWLLRVWRQGFMVAGAMGWGMGDDA